MLSGAAALLLVAVGCAPTLPEVAKPVPVKGTVVLPGGRPLSGGVVTFLPAGDRLAGRYQGWGFVKPDGSFEVAAFADATKGGGVAPGTYKVVIGPRDEGEPRGSNAHLIPRKYQDAATTPLTVEVDAGGSVLPPFALN
jgi:hypothetical protein